MSKSTCTMPECGREHVAKGLCRTHYKAQRRAEGHPGEPVVYKVAAECSECGEAMTKDKRTAESICRPCKTEKRAISQRERDLIAAKPKSLGPRRGTTCKVSFGQCKECGKAFSSRTSNKIYCTPACLYAGNLGDRRREYAANLSKSCRDCGADITHMPWSRLCSPCRNVLDLEAHRSGQQRRRARLRGVEHEAIKVRDVYERDGWRCGICGDSVDSALSYPHRMSASLDHIMPLAHGGTHTKANVQCSHWMCNVLKGDNLPAAQNVTRPTGVSSSLQHQRPISFTG